MRLLRHHLALRSTLALFLLLAQALGPAPARAAPNWFDAPICGGSHRPAPDVPTPTHGHAGDCCTLCCSGRDSGPVLLPVVAPFTAPSSLVAPAPPPTPPDTAPSFPSRARHRARAPPTV